jgi:hypothetical protein
MVRHRTRAPRAPLADRRASFRPRLERLEGRDLPSFSAPIQTALVAPVPEAAVGDFNGDGRQDLAAEGPDGIRVLLSRGDGTFLFDQTYPTGPGSKVAVGDFNHDGTLDLGVTIHDDRFGDFAKVFLGDGRGKFRPAPGPVTGLELSGTTYLAVGDFNHDGIMDLAVAGEDNRPGPIEKGAVAVLLGKGDGNFAAPAYYDVGVPTGMSAGDVNGDGITDLIVFTGGGANVTVLKGLGDGRFADPVTSTLPIDTTVAPAVADFNGDGKADLAFVANDGVARTIGIARGMADGTFALDTRTPLPGTGVNRLVAGDFNGDGKLDLIPLGSDAALLTGKGDDTFAPPMPAVVGAFPGDGAVGDFDGDGHPDVAGFSAAGPVDVLLDRPAVTLKVDSAVAPVANSSYRVTVTATTATGAADPSYDGTVSFAASDASAVLPAAYQFTPADQGVHTFTVMMKSAGAQTLTVSDQTAASVKGTARVNVLPSSAQGTITLAPPRYTSAGLQPVGVAIGDFNGDGKPDLVVANAGNAANGTGGYVTVSFGNGDGTFSAPVRLNAGNNVTSVVVADFNGDGKPDIAAAGTGLLRGASKGAAVVVFLGNGHGGFRTLPAIFVPAQGPAFTPLFALTVGDFNRDGSPDLALASVGNLPTQSGGFIQVLLNKHDGTFTLSPQTLPALAPVAMAAADFDGDGKLDLAVASFLPEPSQPGALPGYKLLVAAGDGKGGFAAPQKIELGGPVNSVVTGDFNGDGKPDLAAISEAAPGRPAAVQVLLNQGGGLFAAPVSYNGGPDPDTLAVADLNGDGKSDLIVVNHSGGKVQVLRGAGAGTFTAAGTFSAVGGPHGVAVGDLNNDGTLDVVVPNAGTPTAPGSGVSILLNAGSTQLQLAVATFTVSARAGFAVITVTRTGDLSAAASVRYAALNGTAVSGVDYLAVSAVLTFQPGEASKTFTVRILPAAIGKPTRTVRLVLSGADGATLALGPATGVLYILG